MSKLPRPPGHHSITPGFAVPNAVRALEFLQRAFDGKVVDRYDGPGGSIAHCEVMLGDSVVMFGDTMPGSEPMPAMLAYYVDDAAAVDAAYERALAAGGTPARPPANQFYGLRSGTVQDPCGNKWTISAVVEDLSREEIQRRMQDMMKG